jgi:hypothetical protein
VKSFVQYRIARALVGLVPFMATGLGMASQVLANVPYPPNCVVNRDLFLPNQGFILVGDSELFGWANLDVTLKDANMQPVSNCPVFWHPNFGNDGVEKFVCHTYYSATTDANGYARIYLAGGGCDWDSNDPQTVEADSPAVVIREYWWWRSPDWDGADGDGSVDLLDFVKFADEFHGYTCTRCHDYNGDTLCNVWDFSIFGDAFQSAVTCQ